MSDTTKDVREFNNALITIRGNSMRCNNSIYSIRNIVSMTFDSIRKEVSEPYTIQANYSRSKFLFKFFLYLCVILGALFIWGISDQASINEAFEWLKSEMDLNEKDFKKLVLFSLAIIPISLLLSILYYIIGTWIKWNYDSYYYIHGLRIVFVNNLTLYFISNSDTGFIEETINGLEEFIANPEYRKKNEMTVNFSNKTVNINKVKNSNVVGGDVEGDVINEQ